MSIKGISLSSRVLHKQDSRVELGGQPIAEDLEQSVESAYEASHKAKEI